MFDYVVPSSFEQTQQESVRQFENLVADAETRFEKLLAAVKPVEPAPPHAEWVTAGDGQKVLVLNEQAVEFFSAIFDSVGAVAETLAKAGKK